MKHLFYFLIPVLIIGCVPATKTTPNYTVKPMPEKEMAFIKKLTTIDSIFKSQKNDITKKEFLESGKKEIAAYLLKNLTIDNWVVKVNKIELNSEPVDYIRVEMFIPIGNWREKKYPDISFPVLEALVQVKPNKVKDQLKALEERDEVYISGKITKNLSGGMNIIPSVIGFDDDNTFENLELSIDLTDIKKTH